MLCDGGGGSPRTVAPVRYGPRRSSLAAKLGLAPLGLGGVLGHHRLVEPLLDIAAEAVTPGDTTLPEIAKVVCSSAREIRTSRP